MYYIKKGDGSHFDLKKFKEKMIRAKTIGKEAPSNDEKKYFSEYYKIHLMPTEADFLPTVLAIAYLLKSNIKPFDDIGAAKAYCEYVEKSLDPEIDFRNRLPGIVLYLYKDAEAVQKVLNALVYVLSEFKGSGLLPRYNAQVNDLVYIAQGNADDKIVIPQKDHHKDNPFFFFELPYMIYYDAQKVGENKNYHLKYPETNIEITQAYKDGRFPFPVQVAQPSQEEFFSGKSAPLIVWSRYKSNNPKFSKIKQKMTKNWVDHLDSTKSSENIRALLELNNIPHNEAYYDYDQKAFYVKKAKELPSTRIDFMRLKRTLKPQEKMDSDFKKKFTNNYTINIMPEEEDFVSALIEISEIAKKNPLLVDSVKIPVSYLDNMQYISRPNLSEKLIKQYTTPGIEVSVYQDSDSAQRVLNLIFDRLKNLKGKGLLLPYNAQVSDLLYVTQGYGDDRGKDIYQIVVPFEDGNLIYYDPKKVSEENKNYHLHYPDNLDIEIIDPERPVDTYPGKGKGKEKE